MPYLERLIDGGTMGNLATMQPILSPMLWNTIATGKLPDAHGILGFMEPDTVNNGARPVTSISRKVKALWNMLSQSGYRSNVVSWWASYPAEQINGNVVTQSVKFAKRKNGKVELPNETVYPESIVDDLANNIVFPDDLLPEDILPFVPEAQKIDQSKDTKLNILAKLLCECSTVQAVTTALMEKQDWDFTAVYFDAIDHFCHGFMHYYPPRMPIIDETEFEIFQHVIPSVYRFHDMILGRLWELAGEDTLIVLCSDHGFESGDGRPVVISNEPAGPADWHRDMGIVVLHGPGIKKDNRIYGANLIDITPTILTYLDLPLGKDMHGRAIIGAFEKTPDIKWIDSWEDIPGDHGMHPDGKTLDARESNELAKQFIALGYVNDHGDDLNKAYESSQVELDYNLAQVYLATGRAELARNILEELLARFPWEVRFIFKLTHSYFICGYFQQVIDLLERAFPGDQLLPPYMRMFKARSLIELDQLEEANAHLKIIYERSSRYPDIHVQLGRIYVGQKKYTDAVKAFEKALEIDSEKAIAHQGLANARLKLKQYEPAAEAALDAVALLHHLPRAHFVLGVSLARMKNYQQAVTAFENACQLHGKLLKGHKWLRHLYSKYVLNVEKANEHDQRIGDLLQSRNSVNKSESPRKHQQFSIPEIPDFETRSKILAKERPTGRPEKPSGRTLTIVSGLPRSGTSLMMQMLSAGGMEAKTDGQRTADIDNPEGYLEWEAVKNLGKNPELFDDDELDQLAVKVISMLLPHLPAKHNYKIIFMMRPTEQVARSQFQMIQRLQSDGSKQSVEDIAAQLERHRKGVLRWMKSKDNVEFLKVDYLELLEEPNKIIKSIAEFLGPELLPNPDQMSRAIRKDLHRQKSS